MSEETQKAATAYLRDGYSVIPVPAGSKNPNRRGWQNERLSPEDVPVAWSNGQNIGILTGEPSGWRVDVDLDCPEAVALAGAFLSETLTSGRESSPGSHWWYIAENAESAAFKDADGSTLVELRAGNGQTLVAPSQHPDGDRYVWGDGEIAKIGAGDLSRRIRELATTVLIARHLPEHRKDGGGGRHDYGLALAGYLLRHGRLNRETVGRILFSAWGVGSYPTSQYRDEAPRDLEGIVRDTAEKTKHGDPVQGGPTLERIAPGMVKILSRWWGWEHKVVWTPPKPAPWPELDEAALYGLAGEIVRVVEPHTEADPAALLVNLLTAFGNAVGRGAFIRVGADKHHLNLFAAVVGESSKARKGMSWGPVREFAHAVDGPWSEDRVLSGLSSGEGLIHAVRDPVFGQNKDGEPVIVDAGETDKRLLLVEGEFGKTLKVMTREGNILSAVVRSAWDGETLKTLTKNNPLKATGAHISIIGHITRSELLRLLSNTDTENGFANRFLWILVKRSKSLPFGGELNKVNMTPLVNRLSVALAFAREVGEIRWGGTARDLWAEVYPDLSEGKPGLFGAATNRAEAQTLRLAALYAVLDESTTIEREHLEAALTLWRYAENSARYVFGTATGDPVQNRITEALVAAPDGLTRTDLRDLFGRHKSRDRIEGALLELESQGKVRREAKSTGGRPVEKWFSE